MRNTQTKNAFKYFFAEQPMITIGVIVLLFLSGLFEAIGIAAFLPFLQVLIDGKQHVENIPVPILNDFISSVGITLNFKNIGIFIISALTAKAIILWLTMRYVSKVVADIAHDFRCNYLSAIINTKWYFLKSHALGENLNAVSTEAFRASQAFSSITKLISAFIQVIIYTISVLFLSWKTYLGFVVGGVAIISVLWIFVRISRNAGAIQTSVTKSLMRQISDIMRAIKPLRAMNLKDFYLQDLRTYSDELREAHFKQMLSAQSLRIFHEPLLVIAAIVGIYIASHFGGLEGGALLVVMVFFMRIMTGLNQAQSEYQRLVKEQSALFSINNTLEASKAACEMTLEGQNIPDNVSILSFKNVCFSYQNTQILKNINIDFKLGDLTILMGESGSGKTTILDLIARFISPSKGKIIVNQTIDLNDISNNSWRSSIGFVPQEVFLFNASLRDNILMGRKNYTDENIFIALRKSGAYSFVKSLEGQLDYQVGENGQHLSGGQKQRLSIARAILHDPKILILDEPTSALDYKTEQALFATFKELSKDTMVIMASHNKDLKSYADQCIDVGAIK